MLSCVVPIRNESGNLPSLISRILEVESISELILVEGGSSDDSYEIAQKLSIKHRNVSLYKQSGSGKFDAVLRGISESSNESIIIWDADGTISKEDTRRLIELYLLEVSLVSGDRLRGSRQKGAMRPLNFLGNRFFSLCFAFLLRRRPFDTLCGTKIFPKRIIDSVPEKILFKDPFGDFSIIFGAYLSGVPIKSVPTQYYSRQYGVSNIRRWKAGVQLLHVYLNCVLYSLLSRGGKEQKINRTN